MTDRSDKERDELLDELQKRNKPRHVYHSKSDFTTEQVSDLKTLLTVSRWMAGVLAGSLLAIIGLIIALSMNYERSSQTSETVREIKSQMQEQTKSNEAITHRLQLLQYALVKAVKENGGNPEIPEQ